MSLPEVHDRDPVRDVAHDAQVVGHEQVGQPEVVLEVVEQVHDLRLHRDVERRHRLVEHDQLGLERQRPGDADPLALAARELVRVPRGRARERGRPRSSSSSHALSTLRPSEVPCKRERQRPRSGARSCAGSAMPNGSWKTICISRRSGSQRASPAVREISLPPKRISPSVGSIRRMSVRDSVVLPQPGLPHQAERLALARARSSRRPRRAPARPRGRRARPPLIGKCCFRCSTASSGAPFSLMPPGSVGRREPDLALAPRAARACGSGSQPAAVGVRRTPRRARARARGPACTCSNACGQRGRKWQPSGPVGQRRRQPGDGGQPLRPVAVHARDRAQQAPGVGVLGVVEDLVERPLLHDPARRTSRPRGRRCPPRRPGRG